MDKRPKDPGIDRVGEIKIQLVKETIAKRLAEQENA